MHLQRNLELNCLFLFSRPDFTPPTRPPGVVRVPVRGGVAGVVHAAGQRLRGVRAADAPAARRRAQPLARVARGNRSGKERKGEASRQEADI